MVTLRYNFEECLEKTITIEGTISPIPWQHLIGVFDDYPFPEYFDLDNHEQIVIYTKTQILKRNIRLKLTGRIIKLTGKSKRPDSQETNSYFEYQMLVDNWNYIDNNSITDQ